MADIVLVTGASGFVGAAVARAFSDYDVAVNQQGLPPGVELLSLL